MRYITTAVLSCVLLAACGGGGGTAPASNSGGNNPPPSGPTPGEIAIQTLSTCAPESLAELLQIIDIFQNLINPVGTLPALTIAGVDNVGKEVGWTFDSDGDQQPDMVGSFLFADKDGNPANVDLSGIQAQGLSALLGALSQLPDMGRFLFILNSTGQPLVFGGLDLLYESGVPTNVNGNIEVQTATCQSVFTLEDVAITGLLNTTGIPGNAVIDAMINSAAQLTGTITFNGTDTVRFDLRVNDSDDVSIDYDIPTKTFTDVTAP